jgi:hypothetical protein
MYQWLYEWFGAIPWWLRLGLALAFIGLSTALYFGGYFWPWGRAVGLVLLLFSGPSDSEKKGYRF